MSYILMCDSMYKGTPNAISCKHWMAQRTRGRWLIGYHLSHRQFLFRMYSWMNLISLAPVVLFWCCGFWVYITLSSDSSVLSNFYAKKVAHYTYFLTLLHLIASLGNFGGFDFLRSLVRSKAYYNVSSRWLQLSLLICISSIKALPAH